MKNIISGLILSLFLVSCGKDDVECRAADSSVVASATERDDVRAYLSANGLTATEHPSGFFYTIVSAGAGTSVSNLCSAVAVSYTGKLTNGTVFDSTPSGAVASFTLRNLIIGWQKGIPLVQKGGKLKLYIPPSLGYGSVARTDQNGNVVIPANSILVFDLEVVEIVNQ